MTCKSSEYSAWKPLLAVRLLLVLASIPMTVECAQPAKIGAMGTSAPSTPGDWVMDHNGNYSWGGTATDGQYSWTTGQAGETPIVGDWNGDGRTKMGVYVNGTWLLDYNGNGVWDDGVDKVVYWGGPGYVPVVGDWGGTGTTKIGAYNPSSGTFLIDANGDFLWEGLPIDKVVYWSDGSGTNVPVVGNWNGQGGSKIGVFAFGTWLLDYDGNYAWDPLIDKVVGWSTGISTEVPVVGDWNGAHSTKIAVYSNGTWVVDYNGNWTWDPPADMYTYFGGTGFIPMVGDWGGTGTTKIAAYADGAWVIDVNANYAWDPLASPVPDVLTSFGGPGQTPVVGNWTDLPYPGTPPPDFSVTSPADATLTTGLSNTYYFTVNPVSGFSFPSSFQHSLTSVPSATGLTATLSASNRTITVTTTAYTPANVYVIGFSVTSGSITHSGAVTINVQPPFSASTCTVSPNPIIFNGQRPTYTAYPVGGTHPNGYTFNWYGSFNFGVGQIFTPATNPWIAPPNGVSIPIAETVGIYDAVGNVVIPCPTLQQYASIQYQDFSFTSPPGPQPVTVGGILNVPITISAINSPGSVNFTTNSGSWPASLSGSLSPASLTGSGTTTLSLAAASNAVPGIYPISVTGTISGTSTSHIASFNLTIAASSAPTMLIPKSAQSAAQGSVARYSLIFNNAGANPLSLAASSPTLPAGTVYTFGPWPASGNGQVELKVTIPANTPLKGHPLTITASGGATNISAKAILAAESQDLISLRGCLADATQTACPPLPAGEYPISKTIVIDRSNISIQGDATNRNNTKLVRDPIFTDPLISIGTAPPQPGAPSATPLTGVTLQNFTVCGGIDVISDVNLAINPLTSSASDVSVTATNFTFPDTPCPRPAGQTTPGFTSMSCGDMLHRVTVAYENGIPIPPDTKDSICNDIDVHNVAAPIQTTDPFGTDHGPYALTIANVDMEDSAGNALILWSNQTAAKKVNDVFIHNSAINSSAVTGIIYGTSGAGTYHPPVCDNNSNWSNDATVYAPRNIRLESNVFNNNNTGAMGGGAVRWVQMSDNHFKNNYIHPQSGNREGGTIEFDPCADQIRLIHNEFIAPATFAYNTDALELYSRNILIQGGNTISGYPSEGISLHSVFGATVTGNTLTDNSQVGATGGIVVSTAESILGPCGDPRDSKDVTIDNNTVTGQPYAVHLKSHDSHSTDTLRNRVKPYAVELTNINQMAGPVALDSIVTVAPFSNGGASIFNNPADVGPRALTVKAVAPITSRCSIPGSQTETFAFPAADVANMDGTNHIKSIEVMFSLGGSDGSGPDGGALGCHFIYYPSDKMLYLDPKGGGSNWTGNSSSLVGTGGSDLSNDTTNPSCIIQAGATIDAGTLDAMPEPYFSTAISNLLLKISFPNSDSRLPKQMYIYTSVTDDQNVLSDPDTGHWKYWGWWSTPSTQ